MSSRVLVINSGSSSLKYRLIDVEADLATTDAVAASPGGGAVLASGLVERIGARGPAQFRHDGPTGRTRREEPAPDHATAVGAVLNLFAELGPQLGNGGELAAVGHRVVQGGDQFAEPVLIDDKVERAIDELSPLAPLHNPPNLAGIKAARAALPDVPHVAVFDTAFHQTLAPEVYTYAIDRDVAQQYGVRRYGFHGTSHAYVSRRAAKLLGKEPADVNVIVLHLGNGASATAVRGGRSVETSMGLTPLEGLVMGTRSGDIDPAVIFHLQRVAGMSPDDTDDLLNRRSGMLGLAGANDMRDVHDMIAAGGEAGAAAQLALAVYCHRLRHYVGAYYAQLGHVDAIAFTAGIGENDAVVRAESLAGLTPLGISIDPQRNNDNQQPQRVISPDGAPVTVFVIPTDEELEIARQSLELVGG